MEISLRMTGLGLRPLRQQWRRSQRHLSVKRVALLIEFGLFVSALAYAFSGDRLVFIDGFGRRSELVVFLLLLTLFSLLHSLVKSRLLSRIEPYFSPIPYDGGRVLWDLAQGMRSVASI